MKKAIDSISVQYCQILSPYKLTNASRLKIMEYGVVHGRKTSRSPILGILYKHLHKKGKVQIYNYYIKFFLPRSTNGTDKGTNYESTSHTRHHCRNSKVSIPPYILTVL